MSRAIVRISDEAQVIYTAIASTRDFERIVRMLLMLETFPYAGEVYEPLFGAPAAPLQTRVLYAGYYGIYYLVHAGTDPADADVVDVLAICDQRRNPRLRFIYTDAGRSN